jgi:trimeric autotransporter adhesin
VLSASRSSSVPGRVGDLLRASARRRRTTAAVAVVAAVGLLGGGAWVAADEQPTQVLQAVDVRLGSDGAVERVRTSTISRSPGGSTTETRDLDPTDPASSLPVRVTVGWVHEGRSGTDLADLRGVDGRVEIDITVQNLTVRPERFAYDVAGEPKDSYALVGAPLTVVASATLPEGSYERVRTVAPGVASATNGVVARGEGRTTVQWASLLAPPRLAASTTFRLVEDAEDFTLPSLSLSVQPGLATDASVSRLLGDAFGGSEALITVENSTIGLIADINATLAGVSDDLLAIQDVLNRNAGALGESATAAIDDTRADLDAAAAAVVRNLEALDSSITSTLRSTSDAATRTLEATVGELLDYLGDPDAPRATPSGAPTAAPSTAPCGVPAAAASAPTTLLEQIQRVSDGLSELSDASEGCVDALRSRVADLIGGIDSCATAPAVTGPPARLPLVCALGGTSARLVAVADRISAEGAKVLEAFDRTAVDDVNGKIKAQVDAVRALQGKAARLKPGSADDTVSSLTALLTDLAADVAAARALTDPGAATDGVAKAVASLHRLALDRRAALDGDGPGSLAQQVRDLAATVCRTPRSLTGAAAEAYVDQLRALVAGGSCERPAPTASPTASAAADPTGSPAPDASATPSPDDVVPPVTVDAPLLTRVVAEAEQWAALARQTDLTAKAPTGVAAQVLALDARLAALADDVREALALVGSDAAPQSLSKKVSEVVAASEGLYDAAAAEAPCGATPAAKPLNALQSSFARLACNQRTVATDLEALLRTSTPDYRAAADDVATAAQLAAALGDASDTELGELARLLTGQLDSAALAQLELGADVVTDQRARLAARRAAAVAELDAAAEEALVALARQVESSNAQQSSATRALQEQLLAVLSDLGSGRSGRGLLGLVQDSAGATAAGTADVEGIARAAASFRGVRLAELADAQLEQQQVARSLEAVQRLGLIGGRTAPAGATTSVVYTLAFEAVG